MSKLHVIFDGYHLQKTFQLATNRAVRAEEVQIVRNAIAEVVRRSTGHRFSALNTTFVTGCAGPLVTDPEFRLIIDRNVCALTQETIESIVFVFRELIPGVSKPYKQPEWVCDRDIVALIDAADPGDFIAISTLDGKKIRMQDGTSVDGIADALKRAITTKDVKVWLFTFEGSQQVPGERLREIVPAEQRVVGQFIPSDGAINIKLTLKSPVITAGRPFSLSRTDWRANGRSYMR